MRKGPSEPRRNPAKREWTLGARDSASGNMGLPSGSSPASRGGSTRLFDYPRYMTIMSLGTRPEENHRESFQIFGTFLGIREGNSLNFVPSHGLAFGVSHIVDH